MVLAPMGPIGSAHATPAITVAPAPTLTTMSLPTAGPLGNDNCTRSGADVTCDLFARTGMLTLPGEISVSTWSYATTDSATLNGIGPELVVNVGDRVTVNLHNGLAEPTSLSLPQLDGFQDDTTGVAAGATKPYTFTASRPGTYLYEAGPTANGTRQVAMGLVGALIVEDPASTSFDDEAVLVLTEIDPRLNANPVGFDMRQFAPQYRLVNGSAFPATERVVTAPGNHVLLRMVNGGIQPHSMAVLGTAQRAIALDSRPLTRGYDVVTESLAPGQSMDSLVTIPAGEGLKYPLYEPALELHNAGALRGATKEYGFGGMLTFLTASGSPTNTAGPVTTNVSVQPQPAGPGVDLEVSATITSTSSIVTGAEYAIDTPGTAGSGISMNPGVEPDTYTATFSTGGLSPGKHTIYVRGVDANGAWGAVSSAIFSLATAGPTVTGISVSPATTSGAGDLTVTATATAIEPLTVESAEVRVDTDGGDGIPMELNRSDRVVALTGTVPPSTLQGLSEGTHVLYIRATDSLGNTGPDATATFAISKSGPTTSNIVVAPNPTNAATGSLTDPNAIRVDATFSDGQGTIADAEGFLDRLGTTGSGFQLHSTSGTFSSSTATGYGLIPISEIRVLKDGSHTIWVHAKNSAGIWGEFATTTLVLDRNAPKVTSASAAPSPTNGAATVTLSATAADQGSVTTDITAMEWYQGTAPSPGQGTAMTLTGTPSPTRSGTATINVSRWRAGTYTLYVRAMDAAGNWSAPVSTTLRVVLGNAIFSDGFESGNLSAWDSSLLLTASSVKRTPVALTATYGLEVSGGLLPRYVVTNSPLGEASYHASFEFNPNTLNTRGQAIDVFTANSGTQVVFQVQYQRTTTGASQLRLVATSLNAAGRTTTSATAWQTISIAKHTVRVDWSAATNATVSFTVDAGPARTVRLDTSRLLIDSARLGQVSLGPLLSSGSAYFDTFVSTRFTLP